VQKLLYKCGSTPLHQRNDIGASQLGFWSIARKYLSWHLFMRLQSLLRIIKLAGKKEEINETNDHSRLMIVWTRIVCCNVFEIKRFFFFGQPRFPWEPSSQFCPEIFIRAPMYGAHGLSRYFQECSGVSFYCHDLSILEWFHFHLELVLGLVTSPNSYRNWVAMWVKFSGSLRMRLISPGWVWGDWCASSSSATSWTSVPTKF